MNKIPCKCGHFEEDHNSICTIKEDSMMDKGEYIVHHMEYVDDCEKFEPINNLQYLEELYERSSC